MRSFCFILTQSLESPGGGGRYFPFAKALVRKGHEVEIIALHHDYMNVPKKVSVIDGVLVRYVGQMHILKRENQKIYFRTHKFLWVVIKGTWALFRNALNTKADVMVIAKRSP